MNRCTSSNVRPAALARWLPLATLLLALGGTACAQGFARQFPAQAVRGTMVVTNGPEITMDGKADRLSPGARIRGTNNMMVLSGALIGQELVVNYTRENTGQVHDVWILTPEEAREKRATGADAARAAANAAANPARWPQSQP